MAVFTFKIADFTATDTGYLCKFAFTNKELRGKYLFTYVPTGQYLSLMIAEYLIGKKELSLASLSHHLTEALKADLNSDDLVAIVTGDKDDIHGDLLASQVAEKERVASDLDAVHPLAYRDITRYMHVIDGISADRIIAKGLGVSKSEIAARVDGHTLILDSTIESSRTDKAGAYLADAVVGGGRDYVFGLIGSLLDSGRRDEQATGMLTTIGGGQRDFTADAMSIGYLDEAAREKLHSGKIITSISDATRPLEKLAGKVDIKILSDRPFTHSLDITGDFLKSARFYKKPFVIIREETKATLVVRRRPLEIHRELRSLRSIDDGAQLLNAGTAAKDLTKHLHLESMGTGVREIVNSALLSTIDKGERSIYHDLLMTEIGATTRLNSKDLVKVMGAASAIRDIVALAGVNTGTEALRDIAFNATINTGSTSERGIVSDALVNRAESGIRDYISALNMIRTGKADRTFTSYANKHYGMLSDRDMVFLAQIERGGLSERDLSLSAVISKALTYTKRLDHAVEIIREVAGGGRSEPRRVALTDLIQAGKTGRPVDIIKAMSGTLSAKQLQVVRGLLQFQRKISRNATVHKDHWWGFLVQYLLPALIMDDEYILADREFGGLGWLESIMEQASKDAADSFIDEGWLGSILERIGLLTDIGILADKDGRGCLVFDEGSVQAAKDGKSAVTTDEQTTGEIIKERPATIAGDTEEGEIQFRPAILKIENPMGIVEWRPGEAGGQPLIGESQERSGDKIAIAFTEGAKEADGAIKADDAIRHGAPENNPATITDRVDQGLRDNDHLGAADEPEQTMATNQEALAALATGFIFGKSQEERAQYLEAIIAGFADHLRDSEIIQQYLMAARDAYVDAATTDEPVYGERLLSFLGDDEIGDELLGHGLAYNYEEDVRPEELNPELWSNNLGFAVPEGYDPHDPINSYHPWTTEKTTSDLMRGGWVQVGGQWEIAEDTIKAVTSPGQSMLLSEDTSKEEYAFWTKFTVDSDVDKIVGIVFRYEDADNYYRFVMHGGDRRHETDMRKPMQLYRVKDGHLFNMGVPMDAFTWVRGRTHVIKVYATNERLRVWVDGRIQYDLKGDL